MCLWYLRLPLHKAAGYVKKKKKEAKEKETKKKWVWQFRGMIEQE